MTLGLCPMDAIIVFDVVQVPPPLLLGPSQIGITSHAMHACNVVLVQLIAFQNVHIATSNAIVISRLSANGRLKFTSQKTGVGVHTEKPFVRTCIMHIYTRTIGSSKNGGGRLHGDGRLLGRIQYSSMWDSLTLAPITRKCTLFAGSTVCNNVCVSSVHTRNTCLLIKHV